MKKDAWRHDLAAYEPAQPAATRFADVDTLRHINHIALYALQQEARLQWQLQHGCLPAEGAMRIRAFRAFAALRDATLGPDLAEGVTP